MESKLISEIECNGQTISYQRQGNDDPTLVLLHGNSGCKQVFHHQFAHFSHSRFSVLAIDLPGHGGSADAIAPERTYTIPGYAQCVDAVLQGLDIQNFILVGWSLGGNIALEMAASGTLAKGLMIFGAPPVGPGMDNIDKAYLPATFETAIGDSQAGRDDIDAYVRAVYGTLDPLPQDYYDCAYRTHGLAREIMVNHWMGGTDGYDQRQSVARLSLPICVAHGTADPFVSLDYLQAAPWKNLWNGAVFQFLSTGHAPFVEDPDSFNVLLEKFASDVL